MKKTIRILALLLLFAISLSMLVSCKEEKVSAGETTAEFARSSGDFSFAMLSRQLSGSDENVIMSPLSIMMALSMLQNGASGEALAELESVMGLGKDEMNSIMKGYLSAITSDDKVSISNSMWARKGNKFKGAFEDINKEVFSAELFDGEPFNDSTVKKLNKWIEDKTDGMIKEMLGNIDDSTLFMLVNTILFDARWVEEIPESKLYTRTFTTASGEEKLVKAMYPSVDQYFEYKGAKGFTNDYHGGRYSFVAILPKEGEKLSDYSAGIDYAELRNAIDNQKSGSVEVFIPLFEYEYKKTVNDILKDMGVNKIFEPGYLDGVSDPSGLYVGEVLHASKIELTNLGTRVGSSTVITMDGSASPVFDAEIYLNRPFIYMIYDKKAGLPLFVGAAMDIGESK